MSEAESKIILPDSEAKDVKSEENKQANEDLFITLQLGVYKVVMMKDVPFDLKRKMRDFFTALPEFYKLAKEIYSIEPLLFNTYIICKLWTGIQYAVMLYYESELLRIVSSVYANNLSNVHHSQIERGIIEGAPDVRRLLFAITMRVFFGALSSVVSWILCVI
jgi:hypothetical protein